MESLPLGPPCVKKTNHTGDRCPPTLWQVRPLNVPENKIVSSTLLALVQKQLPTASPKITGGVLNKSLVAPQRNRVFAVRHSTFHKMAETHPDAADIVSFEGATNFFFFRWKRHHSRAIHQILVRVLAATGMIHARNSTEEQHPLDSRLQKNL